MRTRQAERRIWIRRLWIIACASLIVPCSAYGHAQDTAPALIQWDADLRFRGLAAVGIDPLTSVPIDKSRGVYQRLRLGTSLTKGSVKARMQLQVSGAFGSNAPGDSPVPLGLQVGHLTYQPKAMPNVSVRVGRMALSYGSGRHISEYDFHREGNAYDGILLRYRKHPWLKVDAFAVKLRRNTAQPDKERNLLGLYVVGQPSDSLITEVYLLELRDRQDAANSEYRTFGLRVQWDARRWLWVEMEGAAQIGTIAPADTNASRLHLASALNAVVGVRGRLGLPVQCALFADHYSAQTGQSDDESRAWRPLYPDLYRHMGLQRIFQPTGLLTWGGWLSGNPLPSLAIALRGAWSSVPQEASVPGVGGDDAASAGDNPRDPLGVQLQGDVTWRFAQGSTARLAAGVFFPGRGLLDKFSTPNPILVLLQWRGQF